MFLRSTFGAAVLVLAFGFFFPGCMARREQGEYEDGPASLAPETFTPRKGTAISTNTIDALKLPVALLQDSLVSSAALTSLTDSNSSLPGMLHSNDCNSDKDHKAVDIILYYKDADDVKIAVNTKSKANPAGDSFLRCGKGENGETCKTGTYDADEKMCISTEGELKGKEASKVLALKKVGLEDQVGKVQDLEWKVKHTFTYSGGHGWTESHVYALEVSNEFYKDKSKELTWLSCKQATEDAGIIEKEKFDEVKYNAHADAFKGVVSKIGCPSCSATVFNAIFILSILVVRAIVF